MLEGTLANTSTFIEEAVHEVFEFLRPRNSRYKTNTEFEIGKRVILIAVENKWAVAFAWIIKGRFRVVARFLYSSFPAPGIRRSCVCGPGW